MEMYTQPMPGIMPNQPQQAAKQLSVKDEVMKTIDALKNAGFTPVDAVFEGAVGVKEDTTLSFMDKLNDAQLANGVIRVIYTTDGQSVRFVEIPVGQQQAAQEEPQQ